MSGMCVTVIKCMTVLKCEVWAKVCVCACGVGKYCVYECV